MPEVLRVRVGPSLVSLTDTSLNDPSKPTFFDSESCIGRVYVRVKDYDGPQESSNATALDWFAGHSRKFSITVQMRFKQPWSVADVGFGVAFQNQLKYPMGSSLALAVGKKIDPALSYDTDVDTPYFMSPMACSMNEFQVVAAKGPVPPSQPELHCFVEDGPNALADQYLHPWFLKAKDGENREWNEDFAGLFQGTVPVNANKAQERRDYFRKVANRVNGIYSPNSEIRMQIYAPFIDPNNFKLDLGPLHMSIRPYLRGQPLRFLICGRRRGGGLEALQKSQATRKSEARQWWQDQFSLDASYANEFKSLLFVEFAMVDQVDSLHPGSAGGVHISRAPSPMPSECEPPPRDDLSEAGDTIPRTQSLPLAVDPTMLHP